MDYNQQQQPQHQQQQPQQAYGQSVARSPSQPHTMSPVNYPPAYQHQQQWNGSPSFLMNPNSFQGNGIVASPTAVQFQHQIHQTVNLPSPVTPPHIYRNANLFQNAATLSDPNYQLYAQFYQMQPQQYGFVQQQLLQNAQQTQQHQFQQPQSQPQFQVQVQRQYQQNQSQAQHQSSQPPQSPSQQPQYHPPSPQQSPRQAQHQSTQASIAQSQSPQPPNHHVLKQLSQQPQTEPQPLLIPRQIPQPQSPQSQPTLPQPTSLQLTSQQSPLAPMTQPESKISPASQRIYNLQPMASNHDTSLIVDDDATIHAIWGLAESFVSGNRVPEAIFCLDALCQSTQKSEGKPCKMLPFTEIKTRLRLAELLLLYTENFDEVKKHLDRVQKLLLQSQDHSSTALDFRFQTIFYMFRVYEDMKESAITTQEIQKLDTFSQQQISKALQLAIDNHHTRWFWFFKLQRLPALISGHSFKTALDWLGDDSSIKMLERSDALLNNLVKLTKAQLLMMNTEMSKSYDILVEVEKSLEGLSLKEEDLGDIQQLRIHCAILKMTLKIAYGEFTTAVGKDFKEIKDIEALLKAIFDLPSNKKLMYKWLGASYFYPFMSLLFATGLRFIGHNDKAAQYLEKGLKLINDNLTRLMGVSRADKSYIVNKGNLRDVAVSAKYKFLMLECKITIHLAKAELRPALLDMCELIELFELFPTILEEKRYIILVLSAELSQCLGAIDGALAFIDLAEKFARKIDKKIFCILYKCVLHLRNGQIDKAQLPKQPIEQIQNQSIKIFYQFVQACILSTRSPSDAKTLYYRALTGADKTSNIQLTCRLLNQLTPSYLNPPDYDRAKKMIDPALHLSKRMGELSTHILCMQFLSTISRVANDPVNATQAFDLAKKEYDSFMGSVSEAMQMPEMQTITTFYSKSEQIKPEA